MARKRRTYTDEFKWEALRLWESSGKSAQIIERELGMSSGLLNKWKMKAEADGGEAFPSRGRLTAEQEEIRQLRRELVIAQQERAILKKAVAIFSNPKS